MSTVRLSGQLVCENEEQSAIVAAHLPLHLALTRAEVGCVSFDVTPTDDPLIWQVDECFADAAALHAHQERTAASDWGRATNGIERRYTIEGI
ncbi:MULTISPECIES: antibiotic biosynthesis monooxygenase [unclassified Microbacterium]|uniref:putative quinol monooxygenase n=1 Tax=unclassified Microbacterium TaxID=2609290 RepID=UPI00214BA551|nr:MULTISPECIES: antibiotic biosynthesis monooxygenase [unclassified Microbacterium]MCR2784083.1 antibiotic biosynthesis monooxygenase [Microbacterium sp. zg.B96]MDL5350999.1 antibiotic biosynthesis monooxygenase [Microbacterium sp. zg-YB36]WIM15077.1 antibiotic biosynthesis monooxygenase [Microbacterium sp. zg-B96]